jgi:hypothetical protein
MAETATELTRILFRAWKKDAPHLASITGKSGPLAAELAGEGSGLATSTSKLSRLMAENRALIHQRPEIAMETIASAYSPHLVLNELWNDHKCNISGHKSFAV